MAGMIGKMLKDLVIDKARYALQKAVPNISEWNTADVYEKVVRYQPKILQSVAPIDPDTLNLDLVYEDMKNAENLPSVWHKVGERYEHPYLVSRAAQDTVRYAKWSITKGGVEFHVKQTGMQLSQPKTRLVALQGTRAFNPIQLAANIPGRSVGAHLPRHGLIGINLDYETVTRNQDAFGNRLLDIYDELGHGDDISKVIREQTKLGEILGKAKAVVTKVRKAFGYEGYVIKELSGWGGPKSVLGIGWTDIRSQNTGIDPKTVNLDSFQPSTNKFSSASPYLNIFTTLEYGDLAAVSDYWYNKKGWTPGELDQRIQKAAKYTNLIQSRVNEKYQTLKDKVNTNPYNSIDGEIPVLREDYMKIVDGIYDADNMHRKYGIPDTGEGKTDPIYVNAPQADPKITGATSDHVKDFIRLSFDYPNTNEPLQFRAIIMGLSNNFSPEWSSTDYVGRPDSVYTYKGVKRAVTFTFMVAANSKVEMDLIYEKLNKLSAMTYPNFNTAGIMEGPVIILTIGNYIRYQPGYISSLDFNIEDDYPWDLDLLEPMIIKVNVGFEIIGKITPSKIDNNNPVYYFGHIVSPTSRVDFGV